MPGLPAERLSELIGAIYDCAIDPERWPATIGKICEATDCISGTIGAYVLNPPALRLQKYWNYEPYWIERAPQYAAEVAEIFKTGSDPRMLPLDEPLVQSRHPDQRLLENSRFVCEWRRPQGLVDSIQIRVLSEPNRLGTLGINRHESVGIATDREIAIIRLLRPHLWRAVRISDLLDMKTLEAQALSATLDSFTVGVVLVDADTGILHANKAAQSMIRTGWPIRSSGGRLATAATTGSAELSRAIEMATRDEALIGATGVGIRLARKYDEAPATAHVLPLARGPLRNSLLTGATAAVFVASADGKPSLGVDAVAQTFDLTRAEAQVLELLAKGQTLAQVAAELGIAETTAKTHLMHIFSKTGVSRQADLVRLVMTLLPPVKSAP